MNSACPKTYHLTQRSLKSVEYIPIYEEYRYRELLMAAILKNGRHLGFLGG